jgi:hypothetical protein
MEPYPLPYDERQFILEAEVTDIEKRQVDLGPPQSEWDCPAVDGCLRGKQRDHFWRDCPKLLGSGGRHLQQLPQRSLEKRLRYDAGLEETCSKPTTDLLLALNRLRQLSFRDRAPLQEELTQVLHPAQPRPFLRKYFSLASLDIPDRDYR